MRLADFRVMVGRLATDLPDQFLDGVESVEVSPRTLPHPTRAEVYTLGECIPLTGESDGSPIRSRIVLYHGSFQALARITDDFDWRHEAWETLTHELRHHLEWRAGRPDLEAFDRAAEQNFARHDGEPFEPLFFLDGEARAPGIYQVEDDWFLDQLVRELPRQIEVGWHGAHYRADVPDGATLPAFLTIVGLDEPPPGDVVLVLRRKPGLGALFQRATVWQGEAQVTRLGGASARRPG